MCIHDKGGDPLLGTTEEKKWAQLKSLRRNLGGSIVALFSNLSAQPYYHASAIVRN